MKKHLILAAGVILTGSLFAACGDDDDDTDTTPTSARTTTPTSSAGETSTPRTSPTTASGSPTGTADELEITLEEVDGSGVSGEAVFSEGTTAGMTDIEVTLEDTTFVGAASIHEGTCDEWDDTAAFELGNVTGGAIEAEISATMDELEETDHVLAIFESAGAEPVACASIS